MASPNTASRPPRERRDCVDATDSAVPPPSATPPQRAAAPRGSCEEPTNSATTAPVGTPSPARPAPSSSGSSALSEDAHAHLLTAAFALSQVQADAEAAHEALWRAVSATEQGSPHFDRIAQQISLSLNAKDRLKELRQDVRDLLEVGK